MNANANIVKIIQTWLAGNAAGPLALVGPGRSGKTSAAREALAGLADVAWTTPTLLATNDGLIETIGEGRDVIVIEEGGRFNDRATLALSSFADPWEVPIGNTCARAHFPTLILANEVPTFDGPYADEVADLIQVAVLDGDEIAVRPLVELVTARHVA